MIKWLHLTHFLQLFFILVLCYTLGFPMAFDKEFSHNQLFQTDKSSSKGWGQHVDNKAHTWMLNRSKQQQLQQQQQLHHHWYAEWSKAFCNSNKPPRLEGYIWYILWRVKQIQCEAAARFKLPSWTRLETFSQMFFFFQLFTPFIEQCSD